METMRRHWKSIFLICLISLAVEGCAHQIEIIDPQIKAGKMMAGQTYIAPMDGWFISDEGVARLARAIEYFRYRWQECEASK